MTGAQQSTGHVTALLGEIGNLTLKDVWLPVPSNRAALKKIMKHPKLRSSPIPSFVCETCYFLLSFAAKHAMPSLWLLLLKTSKVSPHPAPGLSALVSDPGKGLAFLFCLRITTLYSHVVLFIFTPITSSDKRCFHIHSLLTVSNCPAK